jgi:acetyltransferase-like isoleucine patch superfamily enzyme
LTKNFLVFLLGVIPNCRIKNFALKIVGFKIGLNTKIGPVLFLNLESLEIGNDVVIRPFSLFRNVSLIIGDGSIIGSWNWISSARGLRKLENYQGKFEIGKECAINSRNYFDVSGGVKFGDFSDLAGVRSTFVTHQISMTESKQTCNSIEIGNHTIVCSNTIFVPGGTRVGNQCLFAMGSVVRAGDYPDGGFYAGNPAMYKKNSTGAWFNRQIGRVE